MCSNLTRIKATIVGETRRTVPAYCQFPKIIPSEVPASGVRSETMVVSFYYNSSVDGQTVTVSNPAGDDFFLVCDGREDKLPFVIVSDKTPDGQQYGPFTFTSGENLISTTTSVMSGDPTQFTQVRQIYLLISKEDVMKAPVGTYSGSILFIHSTNL